MTEPIRRILVRGCPRSGNTMLYSMLCSCFAGVRQLRGETVPVDEGVAGRGKVAVAKYPRPVTRRILGERYEAARAFIDRPPADAVLIFIVRDPRDALMSVHGAFGDRPFLKSAAAWFTVMDEIGRAKDLANVMVLRFEDVVEDADAIQSRIAARTGLEITGKFSCFNRMVERSGMRLSEHNMKELNSLRPLDPSRIYAYKTEPAERVRPIVDMILEHDGAERFIDEFGYEPLR